MAIRPFSFDSTFNSVLIEVSKSVAKTVKFPPLISKRKSSRIGNTELELITPLIICKLFKRDVVETINFMTQVLFDDKYNY